MDRINIKDLGIFAKHGVLPVEKMRGQKFLISASLYVDLHYAGKADDLTKTIDYGHVCYQIKDFVEQNSFDLIETIAERLAETLLIENNMLKKVWIEVKKPDAPIPMDFETISVEIERSWHKAHISVGSNMGDREEHLKLAVDELNNKKGCAVVKTSSFINTAPHGHTDQADFLNCCLELDTVLTHYELLELIHVIENKAGRVREEKWGPRTLDLDIIFYDDLIVNDESLTIPHPEMHKRDFVLTPLCEIAPVKRHPIYDKTISVLLNELKSDKQEKV